MQVLGVSIDPPFVHTAQLEKTKKGATLLSLQSTPQSLYIPSFQGLVISGLSAKHLFIRSLEIQGKNHRHWEEVALFQSEATSHFDPADVLTVPFLKVGHQAQFCTASREALRDHLRALGALGLNPDRVSGTPLALIRYTFWKNPALTDAFLIDLGSSEWTCVWMQQGQWRKSHAIRGGVESLLAAYAEDQKKILFPKEVESVAKQFDLLQLKTDSYPHLFAQFHSLRQELMKTLFSFHRSGGMHPLVFTGRIDAFYHFQDALTSEWQEAIYNAPASTEEKKYAIAIGLALESDPRSLQLRRGEFFPSKNWRQAGLFVLCLLFASLFLSGTLLYAGKWVRERRLEEMVDSLALSLDRWDPTFKAALFAGKQDRKTLLTQWNQTISAHAKEYPYILQTPKVAEVLSWLSHHPLLQEMKKGNDPLEIQSFHYRLLKTPTIDDPNEKSQAQVEIEFKVKNPLNARKFHEELLKGQGPVDGASDIHWEMLNDGYRVSFYLKNRGPHGS